MQSGGAARSKPKKSAMRASAKAGDCDIIFRRPGSAAGRNPEPKSKGTGGPRSKLVHGSGGVKVGGGGGTSEDPWGFGEDGADAALARALKMAGIYRVSDEPTRPGTAKMTRDALHSDESEAPVKLEEAYLAEMALSWDQALQEHRPATATAQQVALMGVDTAERSQKKGEVDIWILGDSDPEDDDDDDDDDDEGLEPREALWGEDEDFQVQETGGHHEVRSSPITKCMFLWSDCRYY